MMPPARVPAFLQSIDRLALLAGVYPAGALLMAAQLAGRAVAPATLLCAGVTGSSVYLLDRIKLADRFLDRADLIAHRERQTWLIDHARPVRLLTATLATAAVLCAWFVHPAAIPLVLAGHMAVVAYAHRSADPKQPPRPKDVLVLKNLLVGAGIACFVCTLLFLQTSQQLRLLLSFAVIAVVVTADAALSDLDDVRADQPFGTRTIAVTAGRRATLACFLSANALAAAGLGVWWLLLGGPAAVLAWTAALPITALPFAAVRRRSVRRLVDARLPSTAIIILVLLAAGL